MTIKVYGYVRVSTREQGAALSPAAQQSAIEDYARCYCLDLEHVEVEIASAATLNRPALQRILTELEEDRASGLVVAALDRLTRSVVDLGSLLERFEARRWALVSVRERMDTSSPHGRLIAHILGSVAQWEREIISSRTKAALAKKRERRQLIGSVPIGWMVGEDGASLVECEEEMIAVRAIEKLRKRGFTLRECAEQLNAAGIKRRNGAMWNISAVHRIDRRG